MRETTERPEVGATEALEVLYDVRDPRGNLLRTLLHWRETFPGQPIRLAENELDVAIAALRSARAPEAPPAPREHPALAVLRHVEWAGSKHVAHKDDFFAACPECQGIAPEWGDGHAPGCALDAALRGAGEATGGEVREWVDAAFERWGAETGAIGEGPHVAFEAGYLAALRSAPAGSPPVEGEAPCGCFACRDARDAHLPYSERTARSIMIVCAECRSKRCPKATDHRHDCMHRHDYVAAAPVPAREGEAIRAPGEREMLDAMRDATLDLAGIRLGYHDDARVVLHVPVRVGDVRAFIDRSAARLRGEEGSAS